MAQEVSNIRALGRRVRISLEDGSIEFLPIPNNQPPQGWRDDSNARYLRRGK